MLTLQQDKPPMSLLSYANEHQLFSGGGNSLIVVANGPGKLLLLCWQHKHGYDNKLATLETNSLDITKWTIPLDYDYERFSFAWEGSREALYQSATSSGSGHVSRSRDAATTISQAPGEATPTIISSVAEEQKTGHVRPGMREVVNQRGHTRMADMTGAERQITWMMVSL